MEIIQKSLAKSLFAVPALMLLVSCGGSSSAMLKDIEVETHYEGSDLYISMTADLGIGAVVLPHVSMPITDNGELIGNIGMSSMSGSNALEIDLNVSAMANIPQGQRGVLPNGGALPIIGANQTIIVPVSDKVDLYLSLSDGQAVVGVSVPFKTLDSIGAKVGNASMFPLFNKNDIVGAAGLYFSPNPGENGFGLFADISQVLDLDMFKVLGLRPDIQAESSLEYSSIEPSSRKERRINRELYYLNRRRARLQLH